MAKIPSEITVLIDAVTKEDHESVKSVSNLKLGKLYLFYYPDPKTKDKLEVYDQLPLVILLDVPDSKYLLGINLHYIPYLNRLNFIKNLQSKGLKIKYNDIVKAWKAAKIPGAYANLAIRKYLINRIASNVKIFDDPKDQYEIVRNILPIFKKKQMDQVYKDIQKAVVKQRRKNSKK